MIDPRPYRHRVLVRTAPLTTLGRFPMAIIGHAVWLCHRFPLSYRDVQELLHQRGIEVSRRREQTPMRTPFLHETLREWWIKFALLFAETCATGNPGGVPGGISMRCVRASMASGTGYGGRWTSTASYSTFSFRHRDTEAAKTILNKLLVEYDVPEVIYTDHLRSCGAAIREIPSLVNVDHQQVIPTARCNNVIEQRASVASDQASSWALFWSRSGTVLPKTRTSLHTTSGAKRAGVASRVRSAQKASRASRGKNERRNS